MKKIGRLIMFVLLPVLLMSCSIMPDFKTDKTGEVVEELLVYNVGYELTLNLKVADIEKIKSIVTAMDGITNAETLIVEGKLLLMNLINISPRLKYSIEQVWRLYGLPEVTIVDTVLKLPFNQNRLRELTQAFLAGIDDGMKRNKQE